MEKRKYFQPEAETMPRDEIKKLQSEKLVKQVKHVYENLPYYRELMDKKGVKPEDIKGIDDLHKLPFIEKSDLRDCYPYGMLAVDHMDWLENHLKIACEFSQPRVQQVNVLSLITLSTTLTFGKTAVLVHLLQWAQIKRILFRFAMVMDSLRAERVCTAARIN